MTVPDRRLPGEAIVPAGMPIEEATRRIVDAAGKGQVALLVTDARGVVIVGVKGTGGLTKLKLDAEGRLLFEGAMAGHPEVLDGSYALRNQLGADRTPERYEPEDGAVYTPEGAEAEAARQLARHQPAIGGLEPIPRPEGEPLVVEGWGRHPHRADVQAVVPLPELEPGYVPPPEPHAFEGVSWGVADRPCTREGCGMPDRHPIHRVPSPGDQ